MVALSGKRLEEGGFFFVSSKKCLLFLANGALCGAVFCCWNQKVCLRRTHRRFIGGIQGGDEAVFALFFYFFLKPFVSS
jgi:hypothetical protein